MVARSTRDSVNSGFWELGTLERKAPVRAASTLSSEEGDSVKIMRRRTIGRDEQVDIFSFFAALSSGSPFFYRGHTRRIREGEGRVDVYIYT